MVGIHNVRCVAITRSLLQLCEFAEQIHVLTILAGIVKSMNSVSKLNLLLTREAVVYSRCPATRSVAVQARFNIREVWRVRPDATRSTNQRLVVQR